MVVVCLRSRGRGEEIRVVVIRVGGVFHARRGRDKFVRLLRKPTRDYFKLRTDDGYEDYDALIVRRMDLLGTT